MRAILETIIEVFEQRGSGRYGEEAVTQLEHALQSGELASKSGANDPLITAALLHDIGHLLVGDELPGDCEMNLDDKHESIGYNFLREHFGDAVAAPVRLHVIAKRYLCTKDPHYEDKLSPTSRKSYHDQGGPMTDDELRAFESEPFYRDALKLRDWDDRAKDPNAEPRTLDDFLLHLKSSLIESRGRIAATRTDDELTA